MCFIYSISSSLLVSLCLVFIKAQDIPQCRWSRCRDDVSQCPEEYPFKLESSACLRPDGMRCSGVSSLCCKTESVYEPYWVGGPSNCLANCSNCNLNDLCYGYTRKCNDGGEVCVFGSQILCGTNNNGGLKSNRATISAFVSTLLCKSCHTILYSYQLKNSLACDLGCILYHRL